MTKHVQLRGLLYDMGAGLVAPSQATCTAASLALKEQEDEIERLNGLLRAIRLVCDTASWREDEGAKV